jgi:hypothetical protein
MQTQEQPTFAPRPVPTAFTLREKAIPSGT